MKKIDIWIAVLLLFLGGSFLYLSTVIPFSSSDHSAEKIIHLSEIFLLIFISLTLIWIYQKHYKKNIKQTMLCQRCEFILKLEWNYCPRCGSST